MIVAAAVLDVMRQEGASHIFCVPGQSIDCFLERLSESHELVTIVTAHEAGAAYMADGYSRASGRFGVCLTIGGPGVTNTVTAMATARTDRSAVFLITGETGTEVQGCGGLQDSSSAGIDASAILSPLLVAQREAASAQIYRQLAYLFRRMLSPDSRGAVRLSVPMDVQVSDVAGQWKTLPGALYCPRFIDVEACRSFWSQVGSSPRIAILAGSGCVQSAADGELLRFAERFSIPVATTLAAKGIFPENHPLSMGVFGWYGNDPAVRALGTQALDVLIVIGSRLNMLSTLRWVEEFQPIVALIVNDINVSAVFNNFSIDLAVLGDARTFLATLNSVGEDECSACLKSASQRRGWWSDLTNVTPRYKPIMPEDQDQVLIHPARIVTALQQVMPSNGMVFSDSGAHAFFVGHYFCSCNPGGWYSSIKYMGAMGWAVPAAIGALLARPDKPCVVVTGDGCMLMHGIEVQTAARYGIPLICIVMNNAALGNPKLRAERISPAMGKLHELPRHDWAGFARALGVEGVTVTEASGLLPALALAFSAKKAIVIDVLCENFPAPTDRFDAVGRGESLHFE